MMTNTTKLSGNSLGLALAGLFLGLGIATTGYFGAKAVGLVKKTGRTVTVKGLSEREVVADVATWRLPFRATSQNRETAMADALTAQQKLMDFAKRWHLKDDEIWPEPISIRIDTKSRRVDERRYENFNVYFVKGAVRVRSTNVKNIQKLTTKTAELLQEGILLGDVNGNIPPADYGYLSLNKIKPGMIAEATKNARSAAQQFAKDSGQKIGNIQYANQGTISILARDGGYKQKQEMNKKVRIVSTVTYLLDN